MKHEARPRRILFTADNGVCVEMYRPLATRLAADDRLALSHAAYLKHTRASFAATRDSLKWMRSRDLPGRILHYRAARWLPFDACVTPSFNDRLDPKNARLKIQIFHGVSFKNYCVKEKALRYDRLYLPGEYHRRRYVESGLFREDDPRLRVLGLPKLDRLVDGTYRRDVVLERLGLDPSRETVLLAPTGDRGNALSFHGERLLQVLRELPQNVIVKPHDHARRDERGVDWHRRLRELESDRFKSLLQSDIVPLLVAADLLITDASSVAFEYALRDRPIVFMDVPEILQGPKAHRFDLATWGRRAGHVVSDPEELHVEVPRLLAEPDEKSEIRRALARDVFHEPGRATARVLRELYADLEMEPSALVIDPASESRLPVLAPAGPEDGRSRVASVPRRRRASGRAWAAAVVVLAILGISANPFDPAAAAVRSRGETQTTAVARNAPDDVCIYVHPTDPRRSRVIVSDRSSGLVVYDLDGRETQRVEIGPQVHVDIRGGVSVRGRSSALVASTDSDRSTMVFHEVSSESSELLRLSATPFRTGVQARGLCLYRSRVDDRTYAFVVGRHPSGDYRMEQWAIVGTDAGIECAFVREVPIGGRSEGCVADDELGAVFVAEEGVGIWKYSADPNDGTKRTLVDGTGIRGHLRGDVEGLALLGAVGGDGYLIASSQGSDDLVVYRRGGDHTYVGRFELVASGTIDAVTRTEGIDGVIADLGGPWQQGLFVAQDACDDASPENVKLVAWSSIIEALSLH